MKKYVIVGTGIRAYYAYAWPLCEKYTDCARLAGLYDISVKRAKTVASKLAYAVPVFETFESMLESVKPDVVIVTSNDNTHDEYIVKALKRGCDVISEKPLTTTPEKFMRIYEAEKESGRKVRTTFNCRYMSHFEKIKETVMSGVLGEICSVHYQWMLDRSHGADYFRRWHRNRENSGSLLIHKSTHHFDVLNWVLDDIPEIVNAFGNRKVYGDILRKKGERCLDCPGKKECEYYFNIEEADEDTRDLYLNCEDDGGYLRDKCLFSEEIDIEDNVSVSIKYKKGTVVSYTLTTHNPYEGAEIVLNGTKARAEFSFLHGGGTFGSAETSELKIFFPSGEVKTIIIPKKDGAHGGSDEKLCDALFRGEKEDPLGRAADTIAGGMSAGIGMAANISLKEKRSVRMDEIIKI